MQLAGVPCRLCSTGIMLDAEATWCANCKTVMHRQCLATADGICPACHRAYEPPENHYFFSMLCPECLRPNQPPAADCPDCKTRTRWDTKEDYETFLARVKDAARVRLLRAALELAGAGLCLLILIIEFSGRSPHRFSPVWFVFGFMLLTGDGIFSLIKFNRLRKFK